jgi:Tfp pilus assembly protein PilN
MIKKIIQNITEGATYTGLEIINTVDGNHYCFLELLKTKSEIVIIKSIVLNSLNELKLHTKKTTPLFLCFNNDIVLTKELSNFSSSSNASLVNEAFPNLDITKFYWELIQKQEHTVVSIARRESIDTVIKTLQELNMYPFKISIGVTSLAHILNYTEESIINLIKHKAEIQNNKLVKLSNNENLEEQFYEINGLKISNYNLLCFGQIIGYLNQSEGFSNLKEINFKFENVIKNERIFQIVGKIALLFFGTLLLLNFIFYNHYFTKVNELNSTLTASSSQKDKLISLETLVNKKEDKVNTISNATNSKTTYYLDVLGESIPASILLNTISYQPLIKRVQEKKPILFETRIITISGISKDIDEFSEWVEKLGDIKWIASTETLDFDYVNESTSDFLIEIKINDTH